MFGIFRRQPSIVLAFDQIDFETKEELQAQVAEVRQFYKFSKLSELVDAIKSHRPFGLAALVFKNARKSFFLHVAPWLMEEGLPFTLLLRPECIGLNRLPLREEMELYASHFPEKVTRAEIEDVDQAGWEHPEVREVFLSDCRKRCGPLPLNELDPTLYFATWGKILELPPELRDFGLYIESNPGFPSVQNAFAFAATQIKSPIQIALITNKNCERSALEALGLTGVLTEETGQIDKRTDPFQLPVWRMEKNAEEKS